MDQIKLIRVSAEYAEKIWKYRAEFPNDRIRLAYNPARIPGMDYLEKYEDGLKYKNILDWLKKPFLLTAAFMLTQFMAWNLV